MIRSQLLRAKPKAELVNPPSAELAAGAPFAYLMMSGQNPVAYMEDLWKMPMLHGSGGAGAD